MGACYSCGSTTPEPNTLPSEDGPTNQRDVNNQQHLQNQWNQSQQQIYQQQTDQTRRNGGSAYGRPASRGPAPRQADSDIARSPQLKVMPLGQHTSYHSELLPSSQSAVQLNVPPFCVIANATRSQYEQIK